MRFEVDYAPRESRAGPRSQQQQQQQLFEAKNIDLVYASKLIEELQQKQRLDLSLNELLFQAACIECSRMATIPQGAFAALQVRKNLDQGFNDYERAGKRDSKSCGFSSLQEGRELTPLKYNSKLMNSIWGLYNRYSVHNFKKIDANDVGLVHQVWGERNEGRAAAAVAVAGVAPVTH